MTGLSLMNRLMDPAARAEVLAAHLGAVAPVAAPVEDEAAAGHRPAQREGANRYSHPARAVPGSQGPRRAAPDRSVELH